MKLVAKATRVITPSDDSNRLDKWAATHSGKLLREVRHFPSGKVEKIYSFNSPEERQRFIDGLTTNFDGNVRLF